MMGRGRVKRHFLRWLLLSLVLLVTLPSASCSLEPFWAVPPARDESVPCILAPDGLVAWWPGDGSPEDIRGENTGTLSEGAAFAEGKVGQAFAFDGSAYVAATTAEFPRADSDRTIELWMKLDAVHEGEGFLAGYGNFGSLEQSYHLGTAAKSLFFSQWGGSIFGPDLNVGEWYHVAVSNTGSSFTLYVNGQPVATGDLPLNTPTESTFYIGGLPNDTAKRFEGIVDEVAIYNRALLQVEIDALYQVGASGKCKE